MPRKIITVATAGQGLSEIAADAVDFAPDGGIVLHLS